MAILASSTGARLDWVAGYQNRVQTHRAETEHVFYFLQNISDIDTGEICGVEMESVRNVRQKILLTGTCLYELTGLSYLLSAHGYEVYCDSPGYPIPTSSLDLIIVALSAEPIAGWGRNLSRIRELRERISGEMLVLVPERLKMLTILQDICVVYSGCESLWRLKAKIHTELTRESLRSHKFRLTEGQRRLLQHFSERGSDKSLPPKTENREWYYHHARLAANVGVRDFRLLLMSGLARELSKMEGIQNEISCCDNSRVAVGYEYREI